MDEARIAELEPDLAGRFRKGLFFADEGHLDPRVALSALTERLRAKGGEIRFGVDGETRGDADVVIDCRGWAARKALPELRGVRGEMMRIRSREVTLTRAVRFLHPRIPLYIVPRANNEFMIGATMIESAEKGAVSVRSAIELLSAAYALHPAFGEAEILEMSADVRPAYPDNEPRIEERGDRIFVNGFYRHGFLLAPAFAERAATLAFERSRGARMKLVVNGEPQDVAAATLADALQSLDLAEAKVATALNGEFVPARARASTPGEGRRPHRDRRAAAGRVRPMTV